MRKKSHISLARFLVNDLQVQELLDHKKAFYLGSILPDCKPSFLTTKHEFDGTFDMVRERIIKLTEGADRFCRNTRAYIRELGEVIHYIADYFTFPHNNTYQGNLKDHCIYEEDLKIGLRSYINTGRAFADKEETIQFDSTDSLFDFIGNAHQEYLSMRRNVEEDCMYIVRICHQVVQAVFQLIQFGVQHYMSFA